MKTTKRFSPLLAAALFLGGLPGCSKKPDAAAPPPPAPQRPMVSEACRRSPIRVTVYIDYDKSIPDKKKRATTENKTVYMCGQDTLQWVASDGEVQEPVWLGENPFDRPHVREKRFLRSDKPKHGSAKKSFDYTIGLKVDGETYEVDPRIEVME